LKAALGATQSGIEFNNRVTMPLNHRVVRLNGEVAVAPTAAPTTVPTEAAPTELALPLCSEITDPHQLCRPDADVESGALAVLLAALALLQIA
jgi:hypothetical protein